MIDLAVVKKHAALARLIRALAALEAEGLDESPVADALRDASDPLWLALTDGEKEEIGRWSESLRASGSGPSPNS